MDYQKLLEDIRNEIAAGASNTEILDEIYAFCNVKADLIQIIRMLLEQQKEIPFSPD